MRALVTGGGGFIGAHVVRALLDAGHEVAVLHLPDDPLESLRGLDVERVRGDVTAPASLTPALRGREWVFHLAALYTLWAPRPEALRAVNVGGTRNVLLAARAAGVQRVVHTSSLAVFAGQGPGRDATEDSPFRLGAAGDLYALIKYESHLLVERWAGRFAREGGPEVVLVAPTIPLGPGDRAPTPTGQALLSALELPVALAPAGELNVGDVRDIARGHLLAAERGRPGRSYLLGGANVSYAALVALALELSGQRKPVVAPSAGALALLGGACVAWARATARPPLLTPASAEIMRLGLRADCSRARAELGASERPLRETVRDALSWFAAHGRVRGEAARALLP